MAFYGFAALLIAAHAWLYVLPMGWAFILFILTLLAGIKGYELMSR